MNNANYTSRISRLVTFAIDGNAVMDADKPTRAQIRRFKSHRRAIEAMTADPILGVIARNRLDVLDHALDYVKTRSDISRRKSINAYAEGDRLIDALQTQGAAGP